MENNACLLTMLKIPPIYEHLTLNISTEMEAGLSIEKEDLFGWEKIGKLI